jgi:hypothetical protein
MTRKGAVKFKTAFRGWPKKGEIPLVGLQAAYDGPWGGVHHGLEWNADAPGKLFAQIESHPLRFVRRGMMDAGAPR